MNITIFIIAVVPILIAVFLIVGIIIQMKAEKEEYNPGPVLSTKPFIEGKLMSIKEDKSGLSRVTVKDKKSHIIYGFSSYSVEDLKYLYKVGTHVLIPIEDPPKDRAYMVDVEV